MSRPTPSRRRNVLLAAAVAAIVLAAGAVWLLLYTRASAPRREITRALHAMGFAVTQDELWALQPEHDPAAAAAYAPALAAPGQLILSGPWHPSREPRARRRQKQMLAEAGPALAAASAASRAKGVRFKWDLDLGSRLRSPEAPALLNLGRLFLLRAGFRAEEGQASGVVEALGSAKNIARHLESQPTEQAMAAGIRLDIERLQIAARIADKKSRKSDVFALLEAHIGQMDPEFDVDRALAWVFFRALVQRRGGRPGGGPVRSGWPRGAKEAEIMKAAEDVMEAAIGWELSSRDLRSYRRWLKGFEASRTEAWRPLSDPGARGLVDAALKRAAWARLARAQLYLLSLRKASGRVPPSRGVIVGGETDPFGRGLLKWRPEGQGWRLWSVGPDGKSQGGAGDDFGFTGKGEVIGAR